MLAGVNRGRNAGEDVIYSGTVAGAVEGTILGIPSFALSQSYMSRSDQPPHWDDRGPHGPDIIRRALDAGIPRDVLININFPNCPPEQVKGIAVGGAGAQSPGAPADRLPLRRARQRLLLDRLCALAHAAAADGTDISALADNRIAVTPLRLDMTDEPFMTQLAEYLDKRCLHGSDSVE